MTKRSGKICREFGINNDDDGARAMSWRVAGFGDGEWCDSVQL
jgi:hypothetical protein